jgi:hypothetical protein
MSDPHSPEEQDGFVRGYHNIPDDEKLQAMSHIQLAEILQSCERDSTKFHVIEREIKKRLAKDQAKINRSNIFLGAGIAGLFTILGAVVGGFLKSCPSCQQVTPAAAVKQIETGNLSKRQTVTAVLPINPSAAQPVNEPSPVQNNAKPSSRNP